MIGGGGIATEAQSYGEEMDEGDGNRETRWRGTAIRVGSHLDAQLLRLTAHLSLNTLPLLSSFILLRVLCVLRG